MVGLYKAQQVKGYLPSYKEADDSDDKIRNWPISYDEEMEGSRFRVGERKDPLGSGSQP